FSRDFGVGLPADAVVRQKTINCSLIDILPTHEINSGFTQDVHVIENCSIGVPSNRCHWSPFQQIGRVSLRWLGTSLPPCFSYLTKRGPAPPVVRRSLGRRTAAHPFSGSVMPRGSRAAFSSASWTEGPPSFFFSVPARIFSRHSARTVLPVLN